MNTMRTRLARLVAACAVTATMATTTATVAMTQAPATAAAASPTGSAVSALSTLPIKGRAPMTGYSRDQFGIAWTDANDDIWGHNGLDTRNDVLSRDLTNIACKTAATAKSAPHCTVASGTLPEPYTGKTINFVRGAATSTAVQIDHVVALGNAWVTGAQYWTAQERTDYANDPLVLIAADGPANEQKGDGDAATWLPPNTAFRCTYVARQIAIKTKYSLWVTQAEHDAMASILSTCPSQTLPGDGTAAVSSTWASGVTVTHSGTKTTHHATSHKKGCAAKKSKRTRRLCSHRHRHASTSASSTAPTAPSTANTAPVDPITPVTTGTSSDAPTSSSDSVYYANCDAVRAAGKAPLYAGQPGYRPGLDRDGDGVACEG